MSVARAAFEACRRFVVAEIFQFRCSSVGTVGTISSMAAATRNSKVKSAVEQRLERADAARSFVATWSGRGYEKGDTASFWIQLLSQVVGLEDVVTAVHFEERVSTGGFIDAHIPSAKTLIEQKALGVNLGKPEMRQGRLVTPFEQAKAYADEMKNSNRPDYISVSNFSHFRIHDLDQERPAENYVEFSLEELPEQFHLLDFIVTGQKARRVKEQQAFYACGRTRWHAVQEFGCSIHRSGERT
ncbi:hypothetical protein HMPREF0293_0288 [Corynebacterium glucuronolyticum ATCC 51866]|uniref:MmeI-like N-terminal domain-containing protein n=2 Tax=Corynebacterium glucuronolyticum TaxID=39791 RepID=A0ABM9XSN7_9CORY|nr:hypothetical protein HMPREF0293_0288 [Corynebacterium glucuronolyticum ATCC 51866]